MQVLKDTMDKSATILGNFSRALILITWWLSSPFVHGVDLSYCELDDANICSKLVTDAFRAYPTYRNLTTPDLIRRLGYPVEKHQVTTDDGYILTMYRVPYSEKSPRVSPGGVKIPVYLMHGFSASSVQWVWQDPPRNLLFMLVDAGFDVWLGNARGTQYSLGHKTLNSNDSFDTRYWDFSHHEMGMYDIPATINLILNVTRQDSIYYIGHSMGTTQFFAAMMLHPELAPRVRTMFSLATSGYQPNANNLFFRANVPLLAPYAGEQVIDAAFRGQFLPYILRRGASTEFCTLAVFNCGICYSAYAVLFGLDPCQTDFGKLPAVLAHLPDTTSVRVASHVSQDMQYGTFRQYDFGFIKNLRKYGSITPPDYDWSLYRVPTVIYYGDNDNLAVPVDVLRTASAMGANLKLIKRIDNPFWDHLDFVLAKDADYYLYNDMLNIMRNHTWG